MSQTEDEKKLIVLKTAAKKLMNDKINELEKWKQAIESQITAVKSLNPEEFAKKVLEETKKEEETKEQESS